MKKWQPGPLKRWLALNDSGVWGDDATGHDDVPVVRSTDIRLDGSWDLSDVALRHVSKKERIKKTLRCGDLVVVKSSGSAAHLGKTALVDEKTAALGACFANFVQRLRPLRESNPRYIWYLLNSHWASAEMEMLGNTTTGLRNLSGGTIGSVTFPGPNLNEQRAIADYLDAETARVDALIDKKQKLIHLFDELRRGVTAAGVAGEFTSSDFGPSKLTWLDQHPRSWRLAKLSLVAKLGSGHTPSRSHSEWWIDCTIPWVTTGEVAEMRDDRQEYVLETREKISQLGIANSSANLHPAGTVVLCRTASAGYSAIMATDMTTSQDFATWTCGPSLRPRFLLLCLRAMRQDLLGRLAMGSTHQTIYMPDIESIRIPLPEVQEQDGIVESVWERIRRLQRIEDILLQQVQLLHERRQALITAAVTGQLEIPEVARGNH